QSVETVFRIKKLAQDIGLSNMAAVGNKVHSQAEQEFLTSSLPDFPFIGFIPYDPAILEADLAGRPRLEASQPIAGEVRKIYQALLSGAPAPSTAH
ncbi:MAG: hypothetical protein V3T68_03785, partial [Dehalococcoidales bacterium]